MATLSSLVPTGYVLTSGQSSQMLWTNILSVSTVNASTMSVSSIGANVVTLNSTLSVSTLTARAVNVSTITGSSISSNTLTLSLVNASTQNTQIYQVATTNPTTSYTAIQASHVSTGTTNNALVLNPSGGNVGVGTTAPTSALQVSASNVNGVTTLTVSNPSNANTGFGGQLLFDNNVGGATLGSIAALRTNNAADFSSHMAFSVNTANATSLTERMRITTAGSVGIGTNTPSATLHVLNPTGQAGNTTMVTAQIIGRPATGGVQNGMSGGFAIGAANAGINSVGRMDVMVTSAASAGNSFGYVPDVPVATFLGNGNVGIGTTAPGVPFTIVGPYANAGLFQCFFNNGVGGVNIILAVDTRSGSISGGWSGTDTILRVSKDNVSNRSINAAGTFNASGADYAEYMTKDSDFSALKGGLLGVLPSGKLTNQFDDAIHFLLKSTNPCMVGGDVWGTEDIVGEKPKDLAKEAIEEEKAAHAVALAAWEARLEAERQKVDRMAFAGQVPVNIQGTTPGDYIIPSRNADGTIGVAAVSKADVTFAQYQSAVGRVISLLADGRANVIVKAV